MYTKDGLISKPFSLWLKFAKNKPIIHMKPKPQGNNLLLFVTIYCNCNFCCHWDFCCHLNLVANETFVAIGNSVDIGTFVADGTFVAIGS